MKIALLGYGKMGKAIEVIAKDRGHLISLKIDSKNFNSLTIESFNEIDVAIDFSTPSTAKNNIELALKSKTPIISGTTGCLEQIEEMKNLCLVENTAFLYASNFSLGVNLFFELNKKLALLMSNHQNYEVSMEEIHHTQKLDAPSGTAISLAEQVINNQGLKKKWVLDTKTKPEELLIEASRKNKVPGTHIVKYESDIDSITIEHEAHSREGFALGAVIAAEWLAPKKGVYTMKDVLFTS